MVLLKCVEPKLELRRDVTSTWRSSSASACRRKYKSVGRTHCTMQDNQIPCERVCGAAEAHLSSSSALPTCRSIQLPAHSWAGPITNCTMNNWSFAHRSCRTRGNSLSLANAFHAAIETLSATRNGPTPSPESTSSFRASRCRRDTRSKRSNASYPPASWSQRLYVVRSVSSPSAQDLLI